MSIDKPIRVLCVMSTLDRGGAESMVMSLFRNIDRRKVIFDFVKHTDKEGAFEQEIHLLGGKVYNAPRYKVYNHVWYTQWWNRFLMKHPEYKIIHGHFFSISSVYFNVAKKHNRFTIGHSHCTKITKGQIRRPITHVVSNILIAGIENKSDYCMACSYEAGAWIFKNKPFRVLNNAIDAYKFRSDISVAIEVRQEFQLDNCLVLGNVSRFNLQKNPRGILEIFRLVHVRNRDSKLLWIGDGPMIKEMQERAIEIGLKNDVIFTGVRSDVHRLLQAMDAFIFPSFYEGLGIAAVEAQAAGVNTFCNDCISKEVAITDLCHFLPIDRLETWADEILKLTPAAPHPDTVEQVIKSGYDINDTARWIQDFYLSINS